MVLGLIVYSGKPYVCTWFFGSPDPDTYYLNALPF